MKRLIRGWNIALGALLIFGSVAFAIATPDTYRVDTIDVYQTAIDNLDQQYIVTFTLEDTPVPNVTATEAWLIRMLDDGVEIASTAPYSFYNSGYAPGVVSFYFAPDDADLPTWGTANLSFEITGNPSLVWDAGSPPTDTNVVINSWNTDSSGITGRVRVLAAILETAYSTDMIELVQGELLLTSNGEQYFEAVIPNLRLIAPDLFSATTISPTVEEKVFTQTYANATEARYDGDPNFDPGTATETALGLSRMWILSLGWTAFAMGITLVLAKKMGRGRHILFLFGSIEITGTAMGFLDFEAGMICLVIATIAIAWAIFYKGSP